jgi:hypothetical protein
LRTDGDADTDLARAFGHAHEHDVHDADAAHDVKGSVNSFMLFMIAFFPI